MAVPIMFQPLVKYADFNGRARRTEFWLWVLFQRLVMYAAQAIIAMTMTSPLMIDRGHPEAYMQNAMSHYWVLLVIMLVLWLPTLAVQVRRLHDTNRTGWWILLPFVTILAGFGAAIAVFATQVVKNGALNSNSSDIISHVIMFMLVAFVPILIAELVIFIFNVLDGTSGNNRFGPDPKGRGGDAAVF